MNIYKTSINSPTLREVLSIDFGETTTVYVHDDEIDFESGNEALFSVDSPCCAPEKFLREEYLNAKIVAIAGSTPYVYVLVDVLWGGVIWKNL
ncbi:MAG: hypothetical protein LUB59_03635 [Candidatus Gastranaerophilales bacterium]|nr:hypothetical protein [Candidatus Gastranaerophilales bacterium]